MDKLDIVKAVFSKNFFLTFACLLIFNFVLGVVSQYLHGVEYFCGKSVARTVSDFAFMEGAVVFFIGTFSAFYSLGFSLRELRLVVFAVVMFCVSVVAGMVG